MGEAEKQLIHDLWRRWNAGERDFDESVADPELEIHSALTGGSFQGTGGLRDWFSEIDEQFESWENRLDDLRQTGPETYVARGLIRARGRHSQLHLEQPVEWRIQLRAGRVLRLESALVNVPEQSGD